MARIGADEFRARLERLGGLAGADVVDPTVKTRDRYGRETEGPNPLPKVRYRVGSRGESIVARQHPDGTFEVIEESAGLKKAPASGAGGDDEPRKPQIVNLGNGKVGVVTTDAAGTGHYTPVDTGPGPTIRRTGPTPGTNAALDDPRSMTIETVTKEQADYDRQATEDRLDRADKADAQARQEALLRIQKDRWTAEQANAEYNKKLDQIHLELQREMHADTVATTRRGQDIASETARRGQDIGLQSDFMRDATSLQTALLPGYAQPEQWSAIRQGINDTRKIGGQPALPDFRGGPAPYDPIQFAQQAAQASRYVLPGAPPPPPPQQPPGPYVLPG